MLEVAFPKLIRYGSMDVEEISRISVNCVTKSGLPQVMY